MKSSKSAVAFSYTLLAAAMPIPLAAFLGAIMEIRKDVKGT
jgi:hypothetical protein